MLLPAAPGSKRTGRADDDKGMALTLGIRARRDAVFSFGMQFALENRNHLSASPAARVDTLGRAGQDGIGG